MKAVNNTIQYSFIILIIFSVIGCEKDGGVKVIKLGHGLDVSHSVHKAMVFMSKRLEEKSKGTMSIDIYPSQQLGSERESLELLQIGSLGMTKVSTAVLENFVPSLRVFGLPYLFRDREHRFKVLGGEIGERLLNASLGQRLKGLTYYDSGTRNFYSKTPLKTPEDLEGLKIRVQESNSAIKMVRLFEASPTPIAWGELYTALQQGIVDGAENNLPSFYLSRHYEVCKHFVLDEHTAIPDELLISKVVWDQLNDQEQQWLKEAATESSEYQKDLWLKSELFALQEIKKAGVTVTIPDQELFRKEVQTMFKEFSEDPEMDQLIKAIQEVK